ncbi:MAG: hypothetical protein ABI863_05650 [Ginsengibacter sp.]
MDEGINYSEHFYQQALRDPGVMEKNANDYPYCSLAGFLLLYHYKKTNHPGFEKLSKKTVLHFKNANWLQFLLDQTPDEKIKEGNEINDEEVTHTLYDPNPGNEIEVTENKPLPAEDFELKSGAAPEIPGAQISQKEPAKAIDIAEPASGEMAFEPLHTIDYFASQGIKITEEPMANDKLGNQMKSFTAWLKSMKKIHPSKIEEQDLVTEKKIQNSAEESNINAEVLTEAMAEVLIKQDKKEKAIEMYNKLSLINPSKSVYFAAKIESIKSS